MSARILTINSNLRLRSFIPSDLAAAQKWYADPIVLCGSIKPGRTEPCEPEMISAMYQDLSAKGELYIIDFAEDSGWKAIGDVTLSPETMPIVIGDSQYRGKGLATQVIRFLLMEARKKGWSQITLKEVYKDNVASQSLFESCGFQKIGEKDENKIYEIKL